MKKKVKEIMEASIRHYCIRQNKESQVEWQTTYDVLTELGLITKEEHVVLRNRIFEEYGM